MKPPTRRPRFWLEITLVVLLKAVLLYTVKQLWFSEPLAHHMRVAPQQLDRQFFGQAAAKPHTATGVRS